MKTKSKMNTKTQAEINMVLAPSGQALSVTDLRMLIRELKQGISFCKKTKEMVRKSWGYENGVLISGNDAVILLQLCQAACAKMKGGQSV